MIRPILRTARRWRDRLTFQTSITKDAIRFSGVSDVYINPADKRCNELVRRYGVIYPQTAMFWRVAVEALAPTVVLDIGANFGELSFSTAYATDTQILLFEANPSIEPYLARSIASHVCAKNMRLRTELVSDSEGEADFYVDELWSGTSSAIGPISDGVQHFDISGPASVRRITKKTIKIDAAVPNMSQHDRLLFKIDVEGFEGRVIAGMQRTLETVDAFIGLIEFDHAYLSRAGTDPVALFSKLRTLGDTYLFRGGRLHPVCTATSVPRHTDVVVTRNTRLPRIAWPRRLLWLWK